MKRKTMYHVAFGMAAAVMFVSSAPLHANGTSVDVKDGIVFLKSEAVSRAQKELTTEYAQQIEGVKETTVSTTNVTTEPDNTARNIRDRDDQTRTPLDQGNNQADVDTTAQIRKEIIADKNMSVNARNVKIITMNGRVILRGPVNTDEEKRLIGEIADRIARPENVDNQLEVKAATSGSNN